MVKFLIIALLIVPFVFIPNNAVFDQFRLPQALAMDIIFLVLIGMSLNTGSKYIYRNKYLSWLIGWVFLNFIIYFFVPFSLDIKGQGRALNTACLEPMIHIFLGLWAVQIILSNFDREDFIRIAKALCLSGSIMGGFAILQYIGFDPLRAVGATYLCGNRVSCCLDNPNLVGNYLALCFPLFFMFKDIKYILGMILVVGGVYVSQAHLAQFLIILSTIIYFLIKNRKKPLVVWTIIFWSIVGCFFIYKFDFLKLHNGMDGRIEVWKVALDKIKTNPIFGQGIGVWRSFDVKTGIQSETHWFFVHNDWLERIVEIGIVGILFLLGVVVNSIRNFSFEEEGLGYFCMFTTFLVMMIGSFPWEVATIATLGIISFCAIEKM